MLWTFNILFVTHERFLGMKCFNKFHRIVVSARMLFWSHLKKVCCSSFLKKQRQNLCFLADDLASGHISWSHFGESRLSRFQVFSAYPRMHFSTCYGVWVVLISIPDRGSCSSHACAWAGASVWKSIHVSTHKNVENLKMKDESWPYSLTAF
jgi:hypothetical protein